MLPEGFCYSAGFLGAEEALALRDKLWDELEWRQYPIRLFGRTHWQPRLVAWCADPGVEYCYSRTRLEASSWHAELRLVRRRLLAEHGLAFNSVLVNAYRNGSDAMGWHADNEPELGECPVIASVSLGQPRRFLIRPRGGGQSVACELENGSLLLMSGRSQADWEHSVPRTRKTVQLRINLTFRQIQPEN